MRCPKCGAFMDDNKEICPMCGVNVRTYSNNSAQNNFGNNAFGNGANFGNNVSFGNGQNSAFGSGIDYGGSTGGYNSQMQPSAVYEKFKPAEKTEKDIFDRYQEHKGLINFCLVLLLFAIIAFAGSRYYKSRLKEEEVLPVVQTLYFEVDDSFEAVGGSSGSGLSYIKSGSKGNACSITISYGANTSENHVADFFRERKNAIEPDRNSEGEVIDKLMIYTTQENEYKFNDVTWHALNVFYKKEADGNPNLLKYRYLTAMYKGYYYNIELFNTNNEDSCSASLDNFAKSLKFIEVEDNSKKK